MLPSRKTSEIIKVLCQYLRDNHGKRKRLDEMSELEKLRAEVKILKAEKERAEMEASLKKNSKK